LLAARNEINELIDGGWPVSCGLLVRFYRKFNGGNEIVEEDLVEQVKHLIGSYQQSKVFGEHSAPLRLSWMISKALKTANKFELFELERVCDYIEEGNDGLFIDGMDLEGEQIIDFQDFQEKISDSD
jgi:hypothetical protein